MNIINLSKQKIFDRNKRVYAYELLFEDSNHETIEFSSNVKEVAQLIMSSITSPELDKLLGRNTLAFVSVDGNTLLKGILDVLDKDRFILNILGDIDLTDKVLSKIIQYKKRGFIFSIDHFDSSIEMITKFSRLFNYIDIIRMDVVLSEPENLEKILAKFKGSRIKLIAENIETQEDYKKYLNMEFDYFQGYYLDKPETMEIIGSKEAAQFTILQLIKIIKGDDSTEKLEFFMKQNPDLSYKLVEFFNKSIKLNVKIESLIQVITLMGRDKLLRWLMVYLYSEVSKNPASKAILELAIKRAEMLESEASALNKDKAYLAGMFSMLSSIFETDIKDLMNNLKMDRDITSLVLENKGIFASSLNKAIIAEKDYLKKMLLANFDKLDTSNLIYTLEDGGIDIDKSKI